MRTSVETNGVEKVKVLDHGFIRLVEFMGSDLSIVRNARVSYNAEWRTGEDAGKDEKLLHYMMQNKHTSPFETVVLTFDIKCPIFVARQWHRHRTWAYNEVSARYAVLPDEYYVPTPETLGKQSKKNKQVRDIGELAAVDLAIAERQCEMIRDACHSAFQTYAALLAEGTPRELARSVLPVATYTHFFGTVNLHNLFHFLRLRLHPHAQYEIRLYAQAMLWLIRNVAPCTVEAFVATLDDSIQKELNSDRK